MAIAFVAAKRSKDPVTQVGACIVNQDKIIVGVGYNGMPNGYSDDEHSWRKGIKSFYGKKRAQSRSRPSDVNYHFFIMKKINADIKLRHFVTSVTES